MQRKKIGIAQIIFFLLFLLTLILPFVNGNIAGLSFMKLDIFAYIFSFKINILFFFLILIIVLEFFIGRIFCGFICPLGNFISFCDWLFKELRVKKIFKKSKKLTFIPAGIILLIIIFKFFNINITGFFDPLSIIHRFFTLSFAQILKPIFKPHFNPAPLFITTAYIFLFIIFLSFLGERVWCKYICPLGFIHRIISMKSRYIRIVKDCRYCKICSDICPMDAIDEDDPTKYDRSLCILCFRCVDLCDRTTVFKFQYRSTEYLSERRNFLKLIAGTIIFGGFITKRNKNTRILRPPGATEESIQNSCLRCMECVKVCPTNVLQPASIDKGIINMFTPEFRPDISYCDYECNLCGKVCPNNSIKNLALKDKQKWKIGIARVYRDLCVAWSKGLPCLVCEEHCPVPEKAIKLKEIQRNNKSIKAPVVDSTLCIGCGICQNHCPVEGSAIRVLE